MDKKVTTVAGVGIEPPNRLLISTMSIKRDKQ